MISPCIFIDVDTQKDFFEPTGAMYIKDAQEIKPNLKKLTVAAFKKKIPIISPIESHNSDTLTRGPYYCMEGTPGQKKIAETTLKNFRVLGKKGPRPNFGNLLKRYKQILVEKNGFDVFTNLNALPLLKKARTKNCVVYGVAIDFGLEKLILRLLEEGFKVWIPVDAVKPINEENRDPVMKELRAKGAEMWNTEFILKNI